MSKPAIASTATLAFRTVQGAADWRLRTCLLLGAMTVFRAFIAGTTDLTDTEAYYLAWARFPSLSYYDHPPLVAWMAALTTFGSTAPIVARLGPVLCSATLGWLLYVLGVRLFSARAGFLCVAVVSVVPAYFFTGFLLNPEAILAPLWLLFLLLLDDLRRKDESWRPVVLGLVIGVGFLAKYTAVLAVPVTLLVAATSAETRRWLRRPSFYLGGLVALLVAAPVLGWNHARHWPSLSLHLVERVGSGGAQALFANVIRVAMGQFLLFHPLVLPGLGIVLALTIRRACRDPRYLLLAAASVPVLLALLVAMIRVSDSEPHWTMVGYMALAVAAGGIVDERLSCFRRPRRLLDGYLSLVVCVSVTFAAAYFAHARTPWVLRLVPPALYDPNVDPLNETVGWDRIRMAVLEDVRNLGPNTVIASNHNVICGHVLIAVDDTPAVFCSSPKRTAFDFLGRRDPPSSSPVVYVHTERYRLDPEEALPGRSCTLEETVDVTRADRVVNRVYIHACMPKSSQ